MEEIIAMVAEKGIIAGAFVYMLHQFLTKFTKTQESIAQSQNSIVSTMITISDTLQSLNTRMELMDRRIERLERHTNEDNSIL